jgi:membrane-bound lytic murein transglycosylase MltF
MKASMISVLIVAILAIAVSLMADPMDDLIQSLDNEYEALIPAPNSSVGTDYPTRQAALGSLYTARSMGLIYQQNQEMLTRQSELSDKYDEIISQNREMIRLLALIAERIEPIDEMVPGTPGSQMPVE